MFAIASLTDDLIRRLRLDQADTLRVALISIDPSRRKSGGALLGDRIRMNAIGPGADGKPRVYMRSLATRDTGSEIAKCLPEAIAACRVAGFDVVIVETSGIGQGDAAIVPHVDVSLYVMTPEFGAASQLEKIDMLDFAEFVAINKFDRKGAADALVRGGRYDEVGAAFGRRRPAVGFSLDLKTLVTLVPSTPLRAAIRAPWGEDAELRRAVRALREQGETVVCVLPGHEHEADEFDCDRELVREHTQWVVRAL